LRASLKQSDDGQSPTDEDNVGDSYSLFVQPMTWSLQRSARRRIAFVSFIRAGKGNEHSRFGVQVDILAK
jgi:hypothetical protein